MRLLQTNGDACLNELNSALPRQELQGHESSASGFDKKGTRPPIRTPEAMPRGRMFDDPASTSLADRQL